MGPGTDVESRIKHGHLPIDEDDRVAMLHDLDYLGAQNPIEVMLADVRAINSFPNSLHGLIGKVGLLLKLTTPLASFYGVGNEPEKAETLREIVNSKRFIQGN